MSTSLRCVSWKPAIGLVELRAPERGPERRLEQRRGAHGAPGDAVARLVERGERAAQTLRGEDRVARDAAVLEAQVTLDRRAHRELVGDLAHGEARRVRRHQEAADAVVGLRHTTATCAIDASPIQRLAPLSTQSLPSRRATVRSDAGSLPASGSATESAKHPTASPVASRGSH